MSDNAAIMDAMASRESSAHAASGAIRIYCVVVTYFPSEGIVERISNLSRQFDGVLVVDNSTTVETAQLLLEVTRISGVQLVCNPSNLGIATALNIGVAAAREICADWVTFFDQDSAPGIDFREELAKVISEYNGVRPLGMVGCNYVLTHERKPRYQICVEGGKNYTEVTEMITSGCAYAMKMLDKLGPLKDAYFIDCVDKEYCWRAIGNGYAICRTTKPLLTHTIGAPTRQRFLGLTLTTLNHSAFRRYFIGRNNIFLIREYASQRPRDCFLLFLYLVKTAIKIAALEDERGKKLRFFFVGIWQGLTRPSSEGPRLPI